jgi:transposase-like protein
MSRRKRRKFDADFKREAVALTKVGDRSVGEVSKDLDLTETALREWVKRADEEKTASLPGALSAVEREELLRLRKQVKRLEMERDILKKATAFFAKESE